MPRGESEKYIVYNLQNIISLLIDHENELNQHQQSSIKIEQNKNIILDSELNENIQSNIEIENINERTEDDFQVFF